MKPRQNPGWIPTEGKNHASVTNPIRHHFLTRFSECGKVLRPVGVPPVQTADDHSLNCAMCQRRKKERENK